VARAQRTDPVRNFKFNVQGIDPSGDIFANMGFMSVEGIAMNTEMLPYREGGFNTTPHKLPGQTDFAPLTMASGVFIDKPEMWGRAKKMFSVQHGQGILGMQPDGGIEDYRYELVVRVMAHPVTEGAASGSDRNRPYAGAVLAFRFFNCWTASVGFSGLNAMDNAIMVHQMTVHHEGFEVFFKHNQARNASQNPARAFAPAI
jgi:phage tail-like protein